MKSSFIIQRYLVLLLSSILLLSLTASASPGTEEVNAKVLSHFASSFANAENVSWKLTKQFAKATFVANNKQTEVFYNKRGRFIGMSVSVSMQELPAGVGASLKHDYASYSPVSAIQYTNAANDMNYYVQLENDKSKIILQIDPQGAMDCIKTERK